MSIAKNKEATKKVVELTTGFEINNHLEIKIKDEKQLVEELFKHFNSAINVINVKREVEGSKDFLLLDDVLYPTAGNYVRAAVVAIIGDTKVGNKVGTQLLNRYRENKIENTLVKALWASQKAKGKEEKEQELESEKELEKQIEEQKPIVQEVPKSEDPERVLQDIDDLDDDDIFIE